jgi:ABC-type molybdate transport system substrate-binding protein
MKLASSLAVVALLAGAALAIGDLRHAERTTLVLYTTPGLKDLLEKQLLPRYENATGERVEPVYVSAGEEYNRLRLSGSSPEADLFLQASPLYVEQGAADGLFAPFDVPAAAALNATYRGASWYAFAWSPLLEVWSPKLGASAPDLATADVRYGLAQPLLSNNGVYTVLLFDSVDPQAGAHALARTTIQPVDSSSTINGVAEGDFDVTLGYEAVTLLYQAKGAHVATALPVLQGQPRLVPVVFTVGLVKGHPNPDAEAFARFLFTSDAQSRLAKSYFRSVLPGVADPKGAADVAGLAPLAIDWSRWQDIEAKLPEYEVRT